MSTAAPTQIAAFDVATIKAQFPLLQRTIDGRPIHYLDSANTSQKPAAVIDAMTRFTETSYAPINRSAYRLAAEATDAYEAARAKVARFINARDADEVVFTKNATEALNVVIQSWGGAHLHPGDVVVLTELEHHANIVPWHILAQRTGIELRWIPIDHSGQLDLGGLDALLDGARVLSFSAMSNVLGTLTPVAELCAAAHRAGALAIVDACQFVPHNVTDVQAWDADFVAFSSHKMCGPSGIGALWGRAELLDATPPFLGGGNMIADVRIDGYTAGAGARQVRGRHAADHRGHRLRGGGRLPQRHRTRRRASPRAGSSRPTPSSRSPSATGPTSPCTGRVRPGQRGGVLSFSFRDIHPHDISQVLDESNVCVRAGHHCAKPLMRILGATATVRAQLLPLQRPRTTSTLCDEELAGATDIFGA